MKDSREYVGAWEAYTPVPHISYYQICYSQYVESHTQNRLFIDGDNGRVKSSKRASTRYRSCAASIGPPRSTSDGKPTFGFILAGYRASPAASSMQSERKLSCFSNGLSRSSNKDWKPSR